MDEFLFSRNMDEKLVIKWLQENHPWMPFKKALAKFALGPYTDFYLKRVRRAKSSLMRNTPSFDFK